MIIEHDLENLLFKIPTFTDERGCLSVVEQTEGDFPFTPQRVFWLYGMSETTKRGGHAHISCWEALIVLKGSVQITLRSASKERTFILEHANEGVLVPPKVWCDLSHFSTDCICLCLASEIYDRGGYIQDFVTL